MADLLALSARYIDEGTAEGGRAVNLPSGELSEVADGIAVVEAFSHVVTFDTPEGLVLFDTSLEAFAGRIAKSLRGWSDADIHTIAYTHGHIDHVGGTNLFIDEARERSAPRPKVIGHENVPARFDRYRLTNGYNQAINARQFGRLGAVGGMAAGDAGAFGPAVWVGPETTFRERMSTRVGDLSFEMHHSKGETDDHLWAWIPERRAICCGDLITWVFPNAGNPQKVQRYPLEWAAALREMLAYEPELLLPAHGLPIAGRERIRCVLDDIATALEGIVEACLARMNAGETLDDLVHGVKVPDTLLAKPYLAPIYDEPEFIVNNVWRLYGGWYDGNPAHLKPAPQRALAAEIAALAGGAATLAKRAREMADAGDFRLACELVEMASLAAPEDRGVQGARAEIYSARRAEESSLMAKGIYRTAAEQSAKRAEPA